MKIKTVCPSQKKDLGQVLSIVSAVDLTLRFTHSKIGLLEIQAKHLKKGTNIARLFALILGIFRLCIEHWKKNLYGESKVKTETH